ncbi:hypothetical protein Acsp03_53660 [Actinomadura sp. NBRC 104412]|uniref:ATP-binding protein n=1 Tax=Actinomadura sp. NBRC 104412 TaxID=3032203 RepID=UPI0024A0425D|nr:ATP-binding protein [Actinomadura sp. NBRC 104412]GLZ07900.1 hypothetical protein Acsp03_53660 [Actinomadura sp. NBRC 104412]
MAQMVQPGHMGVGPSADLSVGGLCVWPLPADESCAGAARTLLRSALAALRLRRETVDDALLAASELATNALQHGRRSGAWASRVPPELWVWARTTPEPQLVVSVFDTERSSRPDIGPQNPFDEHGRGIGIVAALADAWGTHRSRSWLGTNSVPGKVVWCSFGLDDPEAITSVIATPMHAARHLAESLIVRGIDAAHRDGQGVSLVSVPLKRGQDLTIWVEPAHLSFACSSGARVRRPIVDLHDLTEDLVRRSEGNAPVDGRRP